MTTSGNGFSILKLGLVKVVVDFSSKTPPELYPAAYLRNPSTLYMRIYYIIRCNIRGLFNISTKFILMLLIEFLGLVTN